jgi:predicted TIM-barrel fold metal-dependent hydrolase
MAYDIISADSHVLEPYTLWQDALGDRFGDRTPRLVNERFGEAGRFFFTGNQYWKLKRYEEEAQAAGTPKAGYDPAERVRFQTDAKITAEVMNPTVMLPIMNASNQAENRAMVQAAAMAYNDWLLEFCSYNLTRLWPVAAIPMDDVAWALKELDRTIKKGARTAMIHSVYPEGCPPYRDRVYDPFWARCQEAGIPITLHIITGRIPDPLFAYKKEDQENGPNAMLSTYEEIPHTLANEFIFGTIFDRFPRLKVITGELELSWIPHFMKRVDMMQGVFSDRLSLPKLAMPASDYMRTRVWHGLIDDKFGLNGLDLIGDSQVCWGSDFPHSIAIGKDAQAEVDQVLAGVPKPKRQRLLADNVRQLFGAH